MALMGSEFFFWYLQASQIKPPALPESHIMSGRFRWAFGGRVDITKDNLARLAARANLGQEPKAHFRTGIFVVVSIADLNSARREEANKISSVWFLFLLALLCINREFLWGLTSRIAPSLRYCFLEHEAIFIS